jgi:hypothetical protein
MPAIETPHHKPHAARADVASSVAISSAAESRFAARRLVAGCAGHPLRLDYQQDPARHRGRRLAALLPPHQPRFWLRRHS